MASIASIVSKQGYIFWPGGLFLSKLKNREEFEGGLHEKGREKGGKEKSDKTHVEIPLCSLNGRKKNPQKQGRI